MNELAITFCAFFSATYIVIATYLLHKLWFLLKHQMYIVYMVVGGIALTLSVPIGLIYDNSIIKTPFIWITILGILFLNSGMFTFVKRVY